MKRLEINPIVLIIINIIAPSMYIFMSGKYLQIYLLTFVSVLMLIMGHVKSMIKFWGVYLGMLGVYWLTIDHESVMFFGLIIIMLVQAVPCMALALILVRNYNSAQLLSALETMHVPRMLVVAVTITLTYIPTFKREFSYILESMRLRGIAFSLKHPVKSFQYFIVPQLFRCAALSEEVTAAGLVKGIDVPMKRTSYYEQRIRISDIAVLVVFVCGLAGGIIWKQVL